MFGIWQGARGRARALAGLLAIAWGAPLAAQTPQLTAIEDIVYQADGKRFQGVALIEWRSFVSADYTSIVGNSRTVQIVNGVLKVSLAPTTNSPGGAYYMVKYYVTGRSMVTEYWAVRPSATPLKLTDVRVAAPPVPTTGGGGGGGTAGPVEIGDVAGLSDELAARPAKSLTFFPLRAVFVNANGQLETVVGAPGDCLRVDGSSGPCGATPGYVDGETPAGLLNGSNAIFTLANPPNPAASLMLYRNGLLLSPTVDYTLSGNTITFLTGAVPQAGDVLVAAYRLSGVAGEAMQGDAMSGEPAPGSIYNSHIAAGAGIAESKLALNYPTHSSANDPGSGEKQALAGTAGTPSGSNRYVTDQDPRLAAAQPHALLGQQHTDAAAGTASRGDLITGQGVSPTRWTRLALGPANHCLISNGSDAVWNACLFTGFAQGVVPYVGAGGILAEAPSLAWDNAARRLTVGGALTVRDATPATGVTSMVVQAGDGQGANPVAR